MYRRVVFDRAGGRCEICGVQMVYRGGPLATRFEVDHRLSTRLGGDHSYGSCWALCHTCHRIKTRGDRARAKAEEARTSAERLSGAARTASNDAQHLPPRVRPGESTGDKGSTRPS